MAIMRGNISLWRGMEMAGFLPVAGGRLSGIRGCSGFSFAGQGRVFWTREKMRSVITSDPDVRPSVFL